MATDLCEHHLRQRDDASPGGEVETKKALRARVAETGTDVRPRGRHCCRDDHVAGSGRTGSR